MIRKAISEFADHASPHSVEATVKVEKQKKIDGLDADTIDEPAVQRKRQCKRQQIAARYPLDRRKADVQIGCKACERDVDDTGVELRHEGADGRDAGDFPDAGSDPIGLIVAAG